MFVLPSLNFGNDILRKAIFTAIIILGAWGLDFLTGKIILHRVHSVRQKYFFFKTSSYLYAFLAFLIVIQLWFRGLRSLATFLGLLSAGVAIALKEPLSNFAGFIFIVSRRPFVLGNRIEIDGIKGDVIDLRPFMFTLLEVGNWVNGEQSTGRLIHIPNGRVFSSSLANYDKDFEYIWDEIPITITFESNWQKAKEILEGIVRSQLAPLSAEAEKQIKEANRKYMIHFNKLTPIVYLNVADNGVLLTIRYLIKPRTRRTQQQKLWEAVLSSFAAHEDIDLAYATIRYYNNIQEGKGEK